jgi:hypothetical protein
MGVGGQEGGHVKPGLGRAAAGHLTGRRGARQPPSMSSAAGPPMPTQAGTS